MKTNLLPLGCLMLIAMLLIIVPFLLFSCGEKPSFEGTYLRYAIHELGREWDTIIIKGSQTDIYSVTRKWKYERVLDGKTIAPEYKLVHTTAIRLRKEAQLIEKESGLKYHLDKGTLHVGETVYQKLK